MAKRVTLISGDGIGPEVTAAAVKVVDATGADIEWQRMDAGMAALKQYGTPLPDELLDSIRRNKVALKGPITTKVAEGFRSVNVELRKTLDLYANVRPVRNLPGIKTRFEDVDLVVIRENTEDLYSGIEHRVAPGVTESLKIITRKASRRIAKFAFDYARAHNRKRVTAVHKANIMKLSDGLFLECSRGVARAYPEITYDEIIVDNLAMQLVLNPSRFDILLLTNLYGDIISDLCAGLVGGLGLVPGANIGDRYAVFESVHGTAPDIAGKGIADPIAIILSAMMMLEHLGQTDAAQKIWRGVTTVTSAGATLTPDLGGTASTDEVADAIIAAMD